MGEAGAGERGKQRLRVLVVDDDALVGEAIRRVLRESDVVFTQSAAGALGRVQGGARFDAIVCDYSMPGMTGAQLHDELAKTDPGLAERVVLLTGYSSNVEVEAFVQRTGIRCLGKPFAVSELRSAVEAAAIEGKPVDP